MAWDNVISSKQIALNKICGYGKIENTKNSWTSKGILKSSKTKQRLYDKFLKAKNYQHQHEISYKSYYEGSDWQRQTQRPFSIVRSFLIKKPLPTVASMNILSMLDPN